MELDVSGCFMEGGWFADGVYVASGGGDVQCAWAVTRF